MTQDAQKYCPHGADITEDDCYKCRYEHMQVRFQEKVKKNIALEKSLKEMRDERKGLEDRVRELELSNVGRIEALNRLATWAQQDPTGPWEKYDIQKWVIDQIRMALGQMVEPGVWKPTVIKSIEILEERLKALEAERDVLYAEVRCLRITNANCCDNVGKESERIKQVKDLTAEVARLKAEVSLHRKQCENSPTNSEAQERQRAKDGVIELAIKYNHALRNVDKYTRTQVDFIHDNFMDAVEALDSIPSEARGGCEHDGWYQVSGEEIKYGSKEWFPVCKFCHPEAYEGLNHPELKKCEHWDGLGWKNESAKKDGGLYIAGYDNYQSCPFCDKKTGGE